MVVVDQPVVDQSEDDGHYDLHDSHLHDFRAEEVVDEVEGVLDVVIQHLHQTENVDDQSLVRSGYPAVGLWHILVDEQGARSDEVKATAFQELHVVDEAETPAEKHEDERVPQIEFLHNFGIFRIRPTNVKNFFVSSEGSDEKHHALKYSVRLEVEKIVDVRTSESVDVKQIADEDNNDQPESQVRKEVNDFRLGLFRSEKSQVSHQTDGCGGQSGCA